LTFRSRHEIFIRRRWYSVLPSLDATISCRIKKAVVGVTQLIVDHFNKARLHRARLVLRWATVRGCTALVATQTNSASYAHRDGKLVPAKGQWPCSLAGKVTVGLVSRWACVTYSVTYIYIYRFNGLRKGDERPVYSSLWSTAHFIFPPSLLGHYINRNTSPYRPICTSLFYILCILYSTSCGLSTYNKDVMMMMMMIIEPSKKHTTA